MEDILAMSVGTSVKCYVINSIGTDHGRSATSVVENILFSKTLHHHAFDKLLREES